MEFTAPSGATVVINPAPWKDAKALKRAIEREMAIAGSLDLRAFLLTDSSEAVDAALLVCLSRCLYGGEKIIEATFDKPENRQDYYEIAYQCGKVNLGPLWGNLLLRLSEFGLVKQVKKDQESK